MGEADLARVDKFPLRSRLWPGCQLASIAHVVFVAGAPYLAYEQSWDGRNYNVQDSQGSKATIAFGEDRSSFVAVAYLRTSHRAVQINDQAQAQDNIRTLCSGIPEVLTELLGDALQYVLEDVGGVAVPIITAAFWSDLNSSRATAREAWTTVVDHGARLFGRQVLDPDVALPLWAEEYAFDDSKTVLTRGLFERRIASAATVQLTDDEVKKVLQISEGEEGLKACRAALSELSIVFP